MWADDYSSIYIGEWKNDARIAGREYKLEENHTYSLYEVRFNEEEEEIERIEVNKDLG